jgi:pre-60S factor REI1
MTDKQHTFMNNEEFDQYEEFYDFTEENRRIAKRFEEKFGNLETGKEQEVVFELNPKQPDGDEDSWEDVDSDAEETGETAQEENVSLKREFYKLRKMKILKTGELKLPSGKIAGHRDFVRYYKQRLDLEKEENPIQALMRDRARQRRFIKMQMQLVGKTTNLEGNGMMMVKQYNHMLHKMKNKLDKVTRKDRFIKKKNWVK